MQPRLVYDYVGGDCPELLILPLQVYHQVPFYSVLHKSVAFRQGAYQLIYKPHFFSSSMYHHTQIVQEKKCSKYAKFYYYIEHKKKKIRGEMIASLETNVGSMTSLQVLTSSVHIHTFPPSYWLKISLFWQKNVTNLKTSISPVKKQGLIKLPNKFHCFENQKNAQAQLSCQLLIFF